MALEMVGTCCNKGKWVLSCRRRKGYHRNGPGERKVMRHTLLAVQVWLALLPVEHYRDWLQLWHRLVMDWPGNYTKMLSLWDRMVMPLLQ